jgi:hypothetical protein
VRTSIAAALFVLALTGCGSKSDEADNDPSRVERCVDRFLESVRPEDLATSGTGAVRRYIRRMYCGPFASRGWVYDDGVLSIDAQRWLDEGGSEACGSERTETTPCEQSRIIDCAMLRHVRRSEARAYVEKLGREIECDDGTPVEQLGVP